MLILILIDVDYLQKVVLSFEKDSNHQNYSSPGLLFPGRKHPPSHSEVFNFLRLGIYPPPLTAIWKTLGCVMALQSSL